MFAFESDSRSTASTRLHVFELERHQSKPPWQGHSANVSPNRRPDHASLDTAHSRRPCHQGRTTLRWTSSMGADQPDDLGDFRNSLVEHRIMAAKAGEPPHVGSGFRISGSCDRLVLAPNRETIALPYVADHPARSSRRVIRSGSSKCRHYS